MTTYLLPTFHVIEQFLFQQLEDNHFVTEKNKVKTQW